MTKLYETLVSLDPKTAQYLRSFGVNLLPGRFGSYNMLNDWALKALEHTRTLWGTGAYAWVYLDALRQDAGAFGVLDLNLFMEAVIDILDRCSDQHTANVFAAFTAVSLVQSAPGHESLSGRRKRLQLNEAADWIIDVGPEGGNGGGQIVAQGPPEKIAQTKNSFTGQFLQSLLGTQRVEKAG